MNIPSKFIIGTDLPYKTEVTRVHNKNCAPAGMVYLVLKTNTGKNGGYQASKLVPATGLNEAITDDEGKETTVQALLFDSMYDHLKAKFNII